MICMYIGICGKNTFISKSILEALPYSSPDWAGQRGSCLRRDTCYSKAYIAIGVQNGRRPRKRYFSVLVDSSSLVCLL